MSKNRVIVEAVLAGQSHGAVARQYGISKVWVGKLVARWREGGWDAVEKRTTRPKGNSRATPQATIDAVSPIRLYVYFFLVIISKQDQLKSKSYYP